VSAPRLIDGPLLALDTGSPLVSIAVVRRGAVLAERSVELARSSPALLALIEEALSSLGLSPRDLAGVVALRGPGSFTGLRVGLATALGLHQALGLPAAALPTLQVLAAAAPPGAARVVAAVDALRGEWFAQPFAGTPPTALAEPALFSAGELAKLGPGAYVGFGLARAAAALGPETAVLEPGPLAGLAGLLASTQPLDWDASALTAPLYLRDPAVAVR